jgi:hypothetical protein
VNFKKQATEEAMLAFLREGQLRLPPLQLLEVQGPRKDRNAELDALITLGWRGRSYRFAVEMKSLWTPKAVRMAMDQASKNATSARAYPLVMVPYLSEEWIRTLEAESVSGIDLCGNGVVVVPGKLLVLRTGAPNRYRWQGTIKNVYRKNSSIVARLFLLVPQFDSVKAALEEIRRRGGEVTIGTVSKVCKSLEDDLIIERERSETPATRRLRLLQPEKLLDLLTANFVPPEVGSTYRGKCILPPQGLRERLVRVDADGGVKVTLTGASSVDAYAIMAREPVQSFYCTDVASVVASLGGDIRETDRFANVVFLETRDDFLYFDRRPGLVASPIQTYLELARGDKREKETADQVRRVILGDTVPPSRGEG